MASKQDGKLSKLDVTAKQEDVDKRGLFARIVDEVKKFFGIYKKRGPNVKFDILFGSDRDDCLQKSPMAKDEFVVSEVYRVLEINSTLAPDGILIAPVILPEKGLSPKQLYKFHIWIKQRKHWKLEDAEYMDNGLIQGRLMEMETFFVVAVLSSEEFIVGPEGDTFISCKDSRVQVEFPPGAVSEMQKFHFKLDMIDLERYRAYRDYMPDKFSAITGITSVLKINHQLTEALKKDAKITLPVIKNKDATNNEATAADAAADDDDQGDVYFLHWHGDTADVLEGEESPDRSCYSIQTTSFSDYGAFRKTSWISNDSLIEAAKYLSGKLSMCKLLTFVKYRHIDDMPAFVLDCVEATKNRPEDTARDYMRQGLHEIDLSRSRSIPMENNCRIRVDLGGNLECYPGMSKAALNMHFLQFSESNCTVVPVKIRREGLSRLVFRGPHNRWEHPVHFHMFPNKCTKNFMSKKTRLPDLSHQVPTHPGQSTSMGSLNKGDPVLPQESILYQRQSGEVSSRRTSDTKEKDYVQPRRQNSLSDVPVFSEQSLLILSNCLTDMIEWRQIGIFLGVSSNDITKIYKKAEDEKSIPSFELLLSWQRKNRGKPGELVESLTSAFRNVDREDVAEILLTAYKEGRGLTRNDLRNT